MSKIQFFIPGNTPSSKNSKVVTTKGVFHSRAVAKYLRELGVKSYSVKKKSYENYKKRPNKIELIVDMFRDQIEHIKYPATVSFFFYRKDKRQFDYVNIAHIVLDLLVAHGLLIDDSMVYVIPEFLGYKVRPEYPGVEIAISAN